MTDFIRFDIKFLWERFANWDHMERPPITAPIPNEMMNPYQITIKSIQFHSNLKKKLKIIQLTNNPKTKKFGLYCIMGGGELKDLENWR